MYRGRSWRAERFGAPKDVLRVHEAQWAEPGPGRLLVRVRATGVGLPDRFMVLGEYPLLPEPPVEPGSEVAGEVVATGPGSAFAVGDRVMGLTTFLERSGGFSDHAYVIEEKARRIPAALTDEQAAGFMIGTRTAYAGLVQRAALTSGEVLVVLGAAGGSGASAVRLGKALGATVVAVAGSDEKLEFCRRIGADHVVDHRAGDVAAAVREATGGHGADVLYDPVGGPLATRAVGAVARLGRVAIVGYASGSFVTLDPLDMVVRSYSAVGVFGGGTPEEDAAAFDRIVELAASGVLRSPVETVATFDEVAEVLDGLAAAPPGKIVVRIGDGSAP